MFRHHHALLSLIVVLVSTMCILPAAVDAKESRSHFVFDRDTAPEGCEQAKRLGDDEDFRLFCLNEDHAFETCAISCSNALEFEGTIARNPCWISNVSYRFQYAWIIIGFPNNI
jgi:hypothetical protein